MVANVVTVASSPNRTARDVTAVLSEANAAEADELPYELLLTPELRGVKFALALGGHQSTARM